VVVVSVSVDVVDVAVVDVGEVNVGVVGVLDVVDVVDVSAADDGAIIVVVVNVEAVAPGEGLLQHCFLKHSPVFFNSLHSMVFAFGIKFQPLS
jgi:hypothetical protein